MKLLYEISMELDAYASPAHGLVLCSFSSNYVTLILPKKYQADCVPYNYQHLRNTIKRLLVNGDMNCIMVNILVGTKSNATTILGLFCTQE